MNKELLRPADQDTTPEDDVSHYTVLREHRRTDGSFKSLDELEMEYVELTDKLIFAMTNGVEVNRNGEHTLALPTKVIFLDKSARPLAWLVNDLWDKLAAEPDSDEVPHKPDFKFLNIDREQWLNRAEVLGVAKGELNIDPIIDTIPSDKLEGLRSIFNFNHDGSFDTENELDNEVILVIDEVKSTGATLNVAKKILERAFPTSIIAGEHWMTSQHRTLGAVGNADIPLWYKNDKENPANEVGRGVGNRETNRALLDEDPARYFLSKRFPKPDQLALRLREDFKRLADRLGNEVPYIPYRYREDESRERRSDHINKRDLRTVSMGRIALRERDAKR